MLYALRSIINRIQSFWKREPLPVPLEQADYEQAQPVPYDENLLERSRTQWQFGDWESLVKIERDALQHHPDRAKLALLAAAGHAQKGNLDQARSFTRLAKDWGCGRTLISQVFIAGVHNSLGRASALGGQQPRAQMHFESAIQTGTPGGDARLITQARVRQQLDQLGLELAADKQIRPALHWHKVIPGPKAEKQISSKPAQTPSDKADYLNRNGETLYKAGNYKLAVEYFQRAWDLNPNNAWICQNLAEATARLVVNKDEPWECEQLGQAIDETGKWDVAVRHYRRALQLDPSVVQAHQKAQTFNVASPTANTSHNPVFIVGCGHSGTSVMIAIMGSHPNFYPIPKESALFLRTDDFINKTLSEWDVAARADGKTRWVEKTPPHIFQIHRFMAFRPHSRFIIMLRDGRDVVCSLRQRTGYENIQDRLDRWIYDNMAALPYWTHPQVTVVKYEDLVQAPEQTLKSICEFLDEEYHPQMLEYHKTERRWYSDKIEKPEAIKNIQDHNTNRNWQINQPLFDGRGRWRNDMSEAEIEAFKQSPAQKMLEQFGYVENADW